MKTKTLILASLLSLGALATVQANPILGGEIFANGGDVTVKFTGSDAGYDNLLFLVTTSSGTIFEGHLTSVGTVVDLGTFAAGTELEFALNNQQGNVWYSGPGSRNSDGLAHAVVNGPIAGWVSVGFEDLPGGGDKDYNDLQFAVHNAKVPDSSATLVLMGTSLLGLFAFARRFVK